MCYGMRAEPEMIPTYLTILCMVLFLDFCALFYVMRRRVVLYADSLEIRRLLGTKKYNRSDIISISNDGKIFLKSQAINVKAARRSTTIPTNVHYDHEYENWFETLPTENEKKFSFKRAALYRHLKTLLILGMAMGLVVCLLFFFANYS